MKITKYLRLKAKQLCGKSDSTTWRYLKLLESTRYIENIGNTNNAIYDVRTFKNKTAPKRNKPLSLDACLTKGVHFKMVTVISNDS